MSNSQIEQVLDKLVQARLLRFIPNNTQDDSQIELVHEALIYSWPRYQLWLENEQLKRYKRLRLAKDAQDWNAQGQPSGLLWRGQMLQEAKSYPSLSKIETHFIKISEDTFKASKLQEKKLNEQLKSLSINLQHAKAQERELREKLKFLESKATEASLYKKKYKRFVFLTILLFASTIIAISIAIIQQQDNNSQSKRSLIGLISMQKPK